MSESLVQLLKAQAWELAKGNLRAMTNIESHRRLMAPMPNKHQLDRYQNQWESINKRVEDFIKDIEDNEF